MLKFSKGCGKVLGQAYNPMGIDFHIFQKNF